MLTPPSLLFTFQTAYLPGQTVDGLLTLTSILTSVSTMTIGVTTPPVKCMRSGSESYCFALDLYSLRSISNTHVTLRFSNLGFAHSGEGTAQYADQSGMMGYSYSNDEGPVMVRKDVFSCDFFLFTSYFLSLSATLFCSHRYF